MSVIQIDVLSIGSSVASADQLRPNPSRDRSRFVPFSRPCELRGNAHNLFGFRARNKYPLINEDRDAEMPTDRGHIAVALLSGIARPWHQDAPPCALSPLRLERRQPDQPTLRLRPATERESDLR